MMPKLDVFLVVGEESGDQIGFKLMQALKVLTNGAVGFRGVGGARMTGEGLETLFPLHDIAVMGITAVVPRLPTIIRRVYQTVKAIVANPPDLLVIIDSPDFTHAVAKRVRQRCPDIPIVDYVSPSVWAWRPGRAKRMAAYVDHVLALLPFEPDVHKKLSGPPCTYVGHPLIERLDSLTSSAEEQAEKEKSRSVLIMPGSRRSIAERMLPIFRDTASRISGASEFILPAVEELCGWLAEQTARWPVPVRIVVGEDEKFAAFRRARAALVCSGTSALELALAKVPMIVGYRLPPLESLFIPLVKVPSIVLPNLIVGRNVIPEFLHAPCRSEILAPNLVAILADSPERGSQLKAFDELRAVMQLGDETPSARAARICIETFETKTGRRAPRS